MKKNLNFEAEIFNTKKVKTLYHIGYMDVSNKSMSFDDGNGLSVSICPDKWLKIREFDSKIIWKLTKDDVELLNYYSLTKNDFDLATSWGVTEGYLEYCEMYRVTNISNNSEIEDTPLIFISFKDAQKYAKLKLIHDTYEEYLKYENDETYYIEKINGYLPTKKLKTFSMVNVDMYNCIKINMLFFLEKNTKLDGVYWDDMLDENNKTAPRGVIFNSRIESFNKKQFYLCDICKTEIAEYEILDKKMCGSCKIHTYGEDKLNKFTNNYKCAVCGGNYFYGFGNCSCHKYIAR